MLQTHTTTKAYEAGETITATDANEIQFLRKGRATAYDTNDARLLQRQVGDVVWPPSTADRNAERVVADEPSRCARLSHEKLLWLEEHQNEIALALYRYLYVVRGTNTDG